MENQIELLDSLLKEVSHGLFSLMRDIMHSRGTPLRGGRLIHQLLKEPGLTVSEASRSLGMAKSHTSNLLDELQKCGLVEKRPDPSDQRLTRVYVTEGAKKEQDRARAELLETLTAVASRLPPGKIGELIQGLTALRDALSSERDAREAGPDRA